MGPTWGRQDPGGLHVGPMNLDIRLDMNLSICLWLFMVSNTLCWSEDICHLTTWWRHQMETFSALLTICAGNSPVPCEFPAQRPETRSFGIFFDLRLYKRLSKQSWGWWFETLPRPLWRHTNEISQKSRHLELMWACWISYCSLLFSSIGCPATDIGNNHSLWNDYWN